MLQLTFAECKKKKKKKLFLEKSNQQYIQLSRLQKKHGLPKLYQIQYTYDQMSKFFSMQKYFVIVS